MENTLNTHQKTSKAIILLPFIFFLMPTLPIENSQFIMYPLLFVIMVFAFLITKNKMDMAIDKNLIIIFALLLILMLIMGLSSLINYDNASFSALSQLAKPIFFWFGSVFWVFCIYKKGYKYYYQNAINIKLHLFVCSIDSGCDSIIWSRYSFVYL